jgi:hypothetical protein
MNCKSCRRLIFDRRDGILSEKDETATEAHLLECADCRDFYEAEMLLGGRIGAAFKLAAASRPESASDSPATRRRFRRSLRILIPAAAGVAILASVLVFRPSRPAWVIEPTSQEPVVLDDFPDPLRDWVEGRLIVTVEDTNRGTQETFLATRDGLIRRVAERGKNL